MLKHLNQTSGTEYEKMKSFSGLTLYQPFFFKTPECVFTDDNMIEHIDADDPAGVDKPPRDPQVFFGWLRIA